VLKYGYGIKIYKDQILIVERSLRDDIDFKYRILNADGSEVGQCGNGARCFVRYVHDKGLSSKNPITVETLTGQMVLREDEATNLVTVNMGPPRFEPQDIPLAVEQRQPEYHLQHNDDQIQFSAMSMGNPHAVLLVDDVCTAPVQELGAALEVHACGSGTCAAVVAGIQAGLLNHKVTAHLSAGELIIEWHGEGTNVMMTGPAETSFEGILEI